MAVYDTANENLKVLNILRSEQEVILQKINKVHQKLSRTALETAKKYEDNLWIKLRSLYVNAKELAECEERVSKTFVTQLDTLLQSSQTVSNRKKLEVSQKKRKGIKADAEPPRLTSPAVSLRMPPEQANILIGDQVAARVTTDNDDKDEWIVVKVTHYDRDAAKYEVIDEEPGDDDESYQRKFKLPPSHIIPFPKCIDPSNTPNFPTGSQVLAVYPGTTALYKAIVSFSHRKKKFDDYLLEFDDDEEDGLDGLPKRSVPFHHVVPLPEGHRQ
jgi:SAGA-associated factor 29|uniref:SGF29 C-terminal domain-containing protein n=1 Tax=Picea sitchensis TaxID=3332 RepID=B8LQ69_PICSI|nr:unknown [Picea sitchensis]